MRYSLVLAKARLLAVMLLLLMVLGLLPKAPVPVPNVLLVGTPVCE